MKYKTLYITREDEMAEDAYRTIAEDGLPAVPYWTATPAHCAPDEALDWVIRGCVNPDGPAGAAAELVRRAYFRGVLGRTDPDPPPPTPRLRALQDAAYRLGCRDKAELPR